MLTHADQALYEAKAAGRDRIHLWSAETGLGVHGNVRNHERLDGDLLTEV